MPVNAMSYDSKLKFQLDGGVDGNGKAITKTKTYSKVKALATNDALYATAVALSDLQSLPLVSIRRLEEVELTQAL